MFNVCVEPHVLKALKKEGYTYEFDINKIIMRTKEGKLSFEIIYNDDNYELFVLAHNDFCYANSVIIEFDNVQKYPKYHKYGIILR